MTPRTPLRSIALACGLLLAWPSASPAQVIDNPVAGEDCLQLTPGGVSLGEEPLSVSVLVLLDGVTGEQGRRTLALARTAYALHGIELRARYGRLEGGGDRDTELIDAARNQLGGRRPDDVDLVYVLTSRNLNGDSSAGLADCIGGIRFPDRAFAVGEFYDPDNGFGGGPVRLQEALAAKVMAHELGHLFGAHHHYANCAESAALGADNDGCTVMINDIGLASLMFSTVNAGVGRAAIARHGRKEAASDSGGNGGPAGGGLPPASLLLLLLLGRARAVAAWRAQQRVPPA